MRSGDQSFDALLAQLATRESVAKLLATFAKRFGNLPHEAIRDAVQESFYKMLKSYAGRANRPRTLERAERVLHTVIRNTLIDIWRQTEGLTFISLDEDYRLLEQALAKGTIREETPDGVEDDDYDTGDRDADARPQRAPEPGAMEQREALETMLVEEIDTRELVGRIVSDLNPQHRLICVQLLQEWSPREIGKEFQHNGYVLRRWARVQICIVMGRLAINFDHDVAERLYRRGGCVGRLRSAGIQPPLC
jgi:RNA polymerase sigma factor (sigma-70 family)